MRPKSAPNPGNRLNRTLWLSPKQLKIVVFVATLVAVVGLQPESQWRIQAQTSGPCAPPILNPIPCENSQVGNPPSEWQVSGIGDPSIQGFATDISVNRGQTINFKIDTTASAYRLDIYRMGYYNGLGARKIATVLPSVSLPQAQPPCLSDVSTGLTDCGNWAVSASWAVPSTATSGIYFARLVRTDTGGASLIMFIVRNDSSNADILFQTSDTTWQAYNEYGGNSLYVGGPGTSPGRAYKVSYNRPFITQQAFDGRGALTFVFGSEYPMVRWLEANGYNVSYFSGVDTDRRGSLLQQYKVFMSVGHDEYWSAGQRANVEAARNAGKHLAFFSGNEIFWKTRWEPSIDGSNTSYRTLVSYKETHANAKIDPNPAWTGTWRDPRFSPPADGGRPENALSGTIYTVNCCPDDALIVSAAYGRLWFWRNTSFATLPTGQSASVPGMLGHEFDEDLANGAQPAGLIQLSSTTVNVDGSLQDYGSTYAPDTATHSLTLYRHASGALVFGAGTIQWPWSLDANHENPLNSSAAPDVRIKQATVNLLADMGVQPGTLQSGLSLATQSTDTTPPTSIISSPTAGSTVNIGTFVTITGTATDTGGGVVGGVEVSVDGGATWHSASGSTSWSFTWAPAATGSVTIKSRAVDDRGNIEVPSSGVTVTVAPRACPCSLWGNGVVPANPSDSDPSAVEVGVKFRSDVAGYLTGIRFYKGSGNTGTHVGSLWASDGTLLANVTFSNETGAGWQQASLATPVAIAANTIYVASYHAPAGHYAGDGGYFATADYLNAPLRAPATGAVGGNGVYVYSATSAFPTQTFNGGNYWVDVVFDTTAPPADTTPPTVSSVTPANGATGVATGTTVTATFSEAMTASTITSTTFQLRNPANTVITATVSYNASTNTATLTPSSALANNTTYTATVVGGASGVKDVAGNALTTTFTWSFTTVAAGTTLGLTSIGSAVDDGDSNSLNGSKVTVGGTSVSVSAISVFVGAVDTAPNNQYQVAIYTNQNGAPGPLVASSTSGTLTPNAWNTRPLVAQLQANTSYWLMYNTNGRTGAVNNMYYNVGSAGQGAYSTNGVPFGSWPTTFGAATLTTAVYSLYATTSSSADTTPPTVSSVSPVNGATGVATGTTVTATFSEAMTASTITPSTVQLRDAANTLVAASVSYNASTNTATLTPSSALANGVQYTATVVGGASGVKDVAGNALTTTFTWSFTTASAQPPPTCPCSLWGNGVVPANPSDSDPSAVEVGVKFRSDVAGYLTGIRFYKGSGNTGTHVGSLWASDGTLLGSVTFSNETGAGWQQASLATPVAIAANTIYVASYHAPAGHYAGDGGYFATADYLNAPLRAPATGAVGGNGVYVYSATSAFPTQTFNGGNYWVDVVFDTTAPPADTTPPTVSSVTPANGATGVATGTTVTATFSEAMTASTITSTTFQLRNPANTVITATVSYNASTNTATLTPSSALANNTTYTATVVGGASGVKDVAGNALTTTFTWSFTTASAQPPPTCPCSLWGNGVVPANPSDSDPSAVEVGVKFRSDVAGYLTGIRFYKGSGNTGTHVGSLWASDGTLLGNVTFSNETGAGWQQASLATPVAIAANTIYVASYHAPAGHYAGDGGYFATADYLNAPLRAPATGAVGGNGVYVYSATSAFPTQTFNGGNYWVDVVFDTTAPPADTTPPTVSSVTPANGATGVATGTTVTATFSEAMTASTITSTTFQLRNPANTVITATVSYNASTNTATLTPSSALANNTTYTATVVGGASGVKDVAGNALTTTFTWSFTTVADTTPPTVTGESPAPGATGVNPGTNVTVTFSEAMTAATITTTTFQLRDPANTVIAAAVSYNATTRTATLNPTPTLAAVTTYTATVVGGANGVKDLAGNALATNFTWSFTTADTTPPTVTGVSPANGATGVATATAVTATFSEAMTASTFTTSTFQVRTPANTVVAATVNYSASTNTATLTPSSALAYNTTYTGRVMGGPSGVKDVAGNALATNFTWPFTTVADTTPQTVSSVSPVNGATGVNRGANVTATFSEAMTASTITSTTFQLRDPANTVIAATVSYNATTRTATVNPTPTLAAVTTYTATVVGGANGVKDLAGNALATNFSWSFRTSN